jgi:hypothetical protein
MSREPSGPWFRPKVDTLDGPAARVMKTGPFTGGRRLGVAWLGTRRGDTDDGPFQFGGNAVFRELVQHDDGSLGAKFPEEMVPAGEPLSIDVSALGANTSVEGGRVHIAARPGLGVAACSGVPRDARLAIRIVPQPDCGGFGLRLRAGDTFDTGYGLHLSPYERVVRLHDQAIFGVDQLDEPFTLEIVLSDDIIDVCIGRQRTLIDRCPERHGDKVLLYGQDGDVIFEVAEVAALPARG